MQPEQIKEEFNRREDDYKKLSSIAVEILKNRLGAENIKTAYVTSRVKKIDSIIDKTYRKKYDNPFEQMNDIVGIRVVCLYTEDIDKIDRLIAEEFKVISKDRKVEKLGSDKMGYQDLSFVVSMLPKHVGSKDNLLEYKFEIQVRTIMFDAVAIISHDLVYKKEHLLPEAMQRELNLAFSTMELTQYHCDALRERRKDYVKDVVSKAKDVDQTDFLSQPITDDSLRIYTKKHFPDLPIKEHIHALILKDLDFKKYKTLGDIDRAIEYSKKFIDYYKNQSDSFKSGSDYITKSLGYYDEEFLNRHPFAEKTREAVRTFKKIA